LLSAALLLTTIALCAGAPLRQRSSAARPIQTGPSGHGYSLPAGMHFRISTKLLYFKGQAEARGSMNDDIPKRKGFGAVGHIAYG
jgi:hypothetical protein